jgi:hypothetical protein
MMDPRIDWRRIVAATHRQSHGRPPPSARGTACARLTRHLHIPEIRHGSYAFQNHGEVVAEDVDLAIAQR